MIALDGQHYGPYETQKSGQRGLDAQVVVQGEDNKFRTEWTYGNNPYPPPG